MDADTKEWDQLCELLHIYDQIKENGGYGVNEFYGMLMDWKAGVYQRGVAAERARCLAAKRVKIVRSVFPGATARNRIVVDSPSLSEIEERITSDWQPPEGA